MGLEIGLQIIPASAISSVKTTRSQESELTARANEPKAAVFERDSANQNQNTEPAVTSKLRDTVSQLNESVQDVRRELHFSVDEQSGRVVVKVINTEDGETIRQIPAEELLQLARHFIEGGTEGRLLQVIA